MTDQRKGNYAWVWFYAFIVVASLGVATFMIWFNSHLQLTPEKLEAAMQRWEQHGPADYRLTYTKRLGENEHVDTFVVTVRNKRVVDARMNGEPLPEEQLQYHTMDRMLRDIERFLEMDARDKRKNYNVAIFDEQTGAVQRYVRRVMGTRDRVEEQAKVEPLSQ